MALSPAIEEALENAMEAAEAIVEAGRSYGPYSEEARLAKAAFDQWEDEYLTLICG